MSTQEHDSALLIQAAIAIGKQKGLAGLPVSLPEPLPSDRRRHFYTVDDEHPMGKVYGARRLSAILARTETPHLTEKSPKSPRRGMRYCDRNITLDADLLPFASEDARQIWRADTMQRRSETENLAAAARKASGVSEMAGMLHAFPSPDAETEGLHSSPSNSISIPKPPTSGRDAAR